MKQIKQGNFIWDYEGKKIKKKLKLQDLKMLFQHLFGFNPKLNLLEKKHSNCNHKTEYDHEIMEMTSTSSEFLFS